jgi:hypothetical protein
MARTVIPFGPQHPVLPEPVHLDLVVEDEKVVEARPSIGFIHRGLEKLVEKKDYIEFVYIAERICGICSFIHGQTYCQAIEALMNIPVPPRALYLRTVWGELSRIHSHLLWLGLMADAVGFESLFMHSWRVRERVLNIINMPATLDQFQNAIEEGAQFEFLAQPISLLGSAAGKVAGVRCVRMQLKKNGSPGRPEVQPVISSEFDVPADVVLVAFGYKPARLPQMEAFAQLGMDELGCIPVDPKHMTNLEGVFAGGSIVRGPVPISEVVRDSRATVTDVDRYLIAKRKQPPRDRCQHPPSLPDEHVPAQHRRD